MNKVKIEVPNGEWGSLNTKYPSDSDRVADNEFTAGTANVDTSVKGVLTKRLGGVVYADVGGTPKDQYEAIFSDGVRHLLTVVNGTLKYSSGDGQVHNVVSGLTATVNNEFATTQDRVYFGNGVQKKVYDRVTSYGGVTYTFPTQTVKNMGAIVPTTAPSVAVVAGGSVPVGVHTYKATFLYYDFEESNGGLASTGATTTSGNQTVNLTNVPIGGYGVTARKIYRDNNDGLYYLVGTILNNTSTTFSDTFATVTTAIPDDNSTPPDFTLINLYLDRLFLAGVPGDPYFIFYSEPGYPDIFPSTNYVPCNQEDPITGMVVYLDRLIVFNRRSMGQLLGRTSDQFRYAQIEGSVGCVDNRSIQIRVLNGVPVLIWLSDKGFYAYNGNSVVYISDKIEDQVNFNIQQSVIQKNKITHSDYMIFTQGTKTNGINLESSPGQITTKGPYWDTIAHPGASYEEQTNPKKVWDTQAEWETTTVNNTTRTIDTSAKLQLPLYVGFNPATGSHQGTITKSYPNGTHIELPTVTPLGGESVGGGGFVGSSSQKLAVKFIPSVTGTVTSAIISGHTNPAFVYKIYSHNSTTDKPDTAIGTIGTLGSAVVSAGTTYWLVLDSGAGFYYVGNNMAMPSAAADSAGYYKAHIMSGGFWFGFGSFSPGNSVGLQASYVISTAPVALTGQWKSDVVDSKSLNPTTLSYYVNASYPTGTSSVLYVEGSNDYNFPTAEVSASFNNPNGFITPGLSGKRYWRTRLTLTTTNNLRVPSIGGSSTSGPVQYISFLLEFSRTGTWESEVIDCTSDVSSYNNLSATIQNAGGLVTTTVTLKIATSNDGITFPDGFVAVGVATLRRYAKIQVVMTAGQVGGAYPHFYVLTPTVSALTFKWTVVASFTSKSIDTGTTPAGWDIFQTSFTLNGGTINYFLRSASTEVGLSSATWYSVLNGEFPTSSLPTLQWIQWKSVITSAADQIPTIDSTTINWFVGSSAQNIRCASLFYNTNYYLAAAEFENSSNNLLFIFDQENKWRVYRNINASTMSYFFNNPYFGDAVLGKIVKFLQGTSDSGAAIPFDFRSKAFDFSTDNENNDDKIKILEKCILSGSNTGATYNIEYSVDGGDTFYPLKDKDGNSSFTTSEDGKGFYKWLRPDFTQSIPSGYSVMIRIYNNDTKEVEIDSFKLTVFVRKHDPIE